MTSPAKRENCSEHQTTMFSSLHENQKVGKYCDVILKCCDSDLTFNAHSCVLSAASPAFDKLLQDAMEERDQNPSSAEFFPKLLVNLPGEVMSSCMESLLNFIYSGNVDLNVKKEPYEETAKKQAGNGRKTRKGSSSQEIKSKAPEVEPDTDDSGIEISSLYEFLKASKCLGIKTLTEHLESAATLAKMKTGSSPTMSVSERPPRRASAVKSQNLLRSTIEEEKQDPPEDREVFKSPRSRKRRQISGDIQRAAVTRIAKPKPRAARRKSPTEKDMGEENEGTDSQQVMELQSTESSTPEVYKSENVADLCGSNGFSQPTTDVLELESSDPAEAGSSFVEESAQDTTVVRNSSRRKAAQPSQLTSDAAATLPDSGDDTSTEDQSKIKASKTSISQTKKRASRTKKKFGKVQDKPQACEECGKICANSRVYFNHLRSHRRTEHECHYCHKKFKYKSALDRHVTWHTGDGKSCPVCEVPLFSQKEFQQHASMHSLMKMRTQCTICKKWFTSAYVMQLHMRTHTGNELFRCEVCGKKFPYKSSLKMHMLLHTGEKRYVCSHCGKAFTQKIHAKEHELQHTGYKRFVCVYCQRCFAHKCGLSRHISDIHHKSRPFMCETCGKSFPRKTKLIEHRRIHTGEKPYVCEICGMKYKANRSLKSHKKNKHKIIVPNYMVGIWRNGPLPPSPGKPREDSAESSEEKMVTFSFPVNTDVMQDAANAHKEEENIINNIAKEVDVIATESTDNQQSHEASPEVIDPPNVNCPSPVNVIHEASIASEITGIPGSSNPAPLPPMNMKPADGTVISTLPSLHEHPYSNTYIVPLNATATPAFPMADTPHGFVGPGQVPSGLMLTCMMPAQSTVHTGEIPTFQPASFVETPMHPLELSRSASVPPMSTYRVRSEQTAADAIFSQANVQPLPGMHTFQSVAKTHQLLPNFTAVHTGIPVFLPATPVSTVSEVLVHAAEGHIPACNEQTAIGSIEWREEKYHSVS